AVDDIGAIADGPLERIVAAATVERIDAQTTAENIVAAVAGQRVVAGAAGEVFDALDDAVKASSGAADGGDDGLGLRRVGVEQRIGGARAEIDREVCDTADRTAIDADDHTARAAGSVNRNAVIAGRAGDVHRIADRGVGAGIDYVGAAVRSVVDDV